MIEVKFKKLVPEAKLPEKAHPTDVGYDVKCVCIEYDDVHDTYIYHTGLAMETPECLPKVHASLGFPRSSNCNTECYLTNGVGVIDSDGYRGEIQARYKNRTSLQTRIQLEAMKRYMMSRSFFKNYDKMLEEVTVEFTKRALDFAPYKVGDKCFQLVFTTIEDAKIKETDTLSNTPRGDKGYGSTGN